jgi:GST-like protein
LSCLGGNDAQILLQRSAEPHQGRLFLEETGTPYEPIAIDARKGEQHRPDFLAINPNAKLPAIVDGDVTVFDSSAILLYLAEKTGKFLPAKSDKARGELLSWMFFVSSGVGPYFGQSVHFRNFAPEKIPYAINRYAFEAQRHAGILDARLGKQKYMLGDTYTIVDMNVWGWARLIPTVLGEGAWTKFPNLKRLVDEISARPAAQKAAILKDRHKFKTEMDAEAIEAMFPHLKVKVA